jgi:hypothetical protein
LIEFKDVFQYNNDKSIILNYLTSISTELSQRYQDWSLLPLLWAALASKHTMKAKQLAQELVKLIESDIEGFKRLIQWNPLEKLVEEKQVRIQLKQFSISSDKFENYSFLWQFHKQYFLFPIHNVACERAIGGFYRYKQEAAAANLHRVSAVCRGRFNSTQINTTTFLKDQY